jgi:hypothetical protein
MRFGMESRNDVHGGLRGLARGYKQNYKARELIRMLNNGWRVPPEQVEEVRNAIIDVAKNSEDPRAKVSAATFLFNAEVAIEQEKHLLNGGQATQNPGEPQPEPIEPD